MGCTHFRGRVFGAGDDDQLPRGNRIVLDALAREFNRAEVAILCEPSIVGVRSRPPDIVLVDPQSGVHVLEVKGVALEQVLSIMPGGALRIRYTNVVRDVHPRRQAWDAMFSIRDAACRQFGGDLSVPFAWWVIFPRIQRGEWIAKFGDGPYGEKGVIFAGETETGALARAMFVEGREHLQRFSIATCPEQQLQCVMAAFGDSEAIAATRVAAPAPAVSARFREGTMGEFLADADTEVHKLSPAQQRLAMQDWTEGPRLVRGVAGSGKTVVLATQVARTIERLVKAEAMGPGLFEASSADRETVRRSGPVLVVCFNRTLVPFIRTLIDAAYLQRTGESVPENRLMVTNFNNLMWLLSQEGLCRYIPIDSMPDDERAAAYLRAITHAGSRVEERLAEGVFHSVFVDEGQDFLGDEYRVLARLGSRSRDDHPRLFIFYDDAQNLYGRRRPTWADLGIPIVGGRSHVMDEARRNPRWVIEPAFNVLIGTHATTSRSVGTRDFADLDSLRRKNLIEERADGHVGIRFAGREGEQPPILHLLKTTQEEDQHLASRCRELLESEQLQPHQMIVITCTRQRSEQIAAVLARALAEMGGAYAAIRVRCPFAEGEKDQHGIQPGAISVSTVASLKGYDAPYVIVAGANLFPATTEGRAGFYVGCTRARHWLEVTASGTSPLGEEFRASLAASGANAAPHE